MFYNTLDDLLVSKEDNGIFSFRNQDSVVIQGGSVELERRWRRGLRTRIGYTYAEVTDSTTGAGMPNSPKHLAKASLPIPLDEERIYAGVEFQARSRRRGYSSKPSRSGYGLMNLNLFSRDLLPGLEFSAGIYNLLDASYADPTTEDFVHYAIPQDGRNFRLKLTVKF